MDIGQEVRVIQVSDLEEHLEMVPVEPLPKEWPVERPAIVNEPAETD